MNGFWIAVIVAPALIAAAALAGLRRSALATRLADQPNERSLHATPTPRIGGLGIALGVLPVAVASSDAPIAAILACAAALAVVSFADDLHNLPVTVRLPAHLVAAGIALAAVASGISPLAFAVTLFVIAWATNLYNFMDGSDGLAGSMSVIGFGALAIAAFLAHAMPLAFACAAIASAAAGFLAFNVPPARAFLGDAGSVPLGFLAGALGAYGTLVEAWPFWFAPAVFAPFGMDATVTLVRRLLRGERLWSAHRGHYYQRLVLAGWSARRLMLCAWMLMLGCAAAAFAALFAGEMLRCGIILAGLMTHAALFAVIDLRLARGRTNNNKQPSREP